MARGILLVFSNPSAPELLSEFDRWYTDVHLPEFLRIPGVNAARRFQLSASQMPQPAGEPFGGRQFLAAYEIETDDFAALCDEIMASAKHRTQSGAIERDPLPVALLFEQRGKEQTAAQPREEPGA